MDDDWEPQVGETVEIIEGALTESVGIVEAIDQEKGQVRVRVSIFGRETSFELPRSWVRKSQSIS